MSDSIFRKTTWFNTVTEKEVYGIKVRVEGKWYDAGDGDGPLLFDNEVARDGKLADLKAKGLPAFSG